MSGVVGIPGNPIYNETEPWKTWSIHEIYLGDIGENKYVPKVNDYVIEPETGNLFIVNSLDQVTYVPELKPIKLNADTAFNTTDMLISNTDDNYRVYFDKSVLPYTLAVDALVKIYSTSANFARLYKGYFIDNTKLISRRYDNSGNFIGSDIPLSLVAYNTHDNYAIKAIPTCNTTTELQDGEVVTAIVYDTNGKVLSKRSLIVEETTYVPQAFAEQKFIVNISLKTPFSSINTPDIINYPINLPLESFNPIGIVHYNDGSTVNYPIDGDKFSLYGLDKFTSTIIGHKVPLVLSYRLDANESALASVSSDGFYVTSPYTLHVSNPNTSYNVKLFIYPVWIDSVNGYNYKVFLMNLDRNILFDVTSKVSLATNSTSFNPLLYGVTQRMTFMLELSNVSGIFNYFIHTQTVDIVLRAPANDIGTSNFWEVSNQIPTNVPYYGSNLKAVRNLAVQSKVNIGNGISNLNDWLTKLYLPTNPLVNPLTELRPIDPTHIEVKYLNQSVIIPIANYNSDVLFSSALPAYSNVEIVFLKQTASGYLMLSVASLLVV